MQNRLIDWIQRASTYMGAQPLTKIWAAARSIFIDIHRSCRIFQARSTRAYVANIFIKSACKFAKASQNMLPIFGHHTE